MGFSIAHCVIAHTMVICVAEPDTSSLTVPDLLDLLFGLPGCLCHTLVDATPPDCDRRNVLHDLSNSLSNYLLHHPALTTHQNIRTLLHKLLTPTPNFPVHRHGRQCNLLRLC